MTIYGIFPDMYSNTSTGLLLDKNDHIIVKRANMYLTNYYIIKII